MPEKQLDIYSVLLPIFFISSFLAPIPFTYRKTKSDSTSRRSFRIFVKLFLVFARLGMVHLVHYFGLSASLHKSYAHVRNSNIQQAEYSIWGYSGGRHHLSPRNFMPYVQKVTTF